MILPIGRENLRHIINMVTIMGNDILTMEEVAAHLRVSERTVGVWALNGEIPCCKVGTAWEFRRDEVENWVNCRLGSGRLRDSLMPLQFDRVLTRDHALVVPKANKHDILKQMIDMLAQSPVIKSRNELEEGIFQRERLMSTGIGMEIGIPHVRLGSARDVIMGAALVSQGVTDYDSLDSKPVKIIFMIVARSDQHAQHLKLLAQISSRLKDDAFRRILTDCQDVDSFYNVLMQGCGEK